MNDQARWARTITRAGLVFGLLLGGSWACGGCRKQVDKPPAEVTTPPSVRLYVVANTAGALEPCGCVKDMLGGIDHAAALVNSAKKPAPASLLVGAGPLFFADPQLDEKARTQELWKAEALAEGLRDMGFQAWAPAYNDWAGGKAVLAELRAKSGGHLVAANLQGDGAQATKVVDAQGHKVGFVGLSVPEFAGRMPEGISRTGAPAEQLRAGLAQLEGAGAQIRVALLAMPRGEAIRLIDQVRGFDVVVVGKPFERGHADDEAAPPLLVEGALVVQPPNHLQAVAVVDLYVRGGSYDFADGSDIATVERKDSLQRRIHDLEQRLREWEHQGTSVRPEDLKARRQDLERARAELAALSKPKPPPEGSFFRYEMVQVREGLGSDQQVAARLAAYYRKVNEHNRVAFQDRAPEPVPAGQSGYIGIEQCSTCHAEEREFWDRTRHAKAYETLATDHKQFNLDCVGCHVTGYEKPGGSTVTHVESLKDVQCEVCHGPGSRHPNDPTNRALITRLPARDLCATQCHHPPHVHTAWSVDEAWKHIIGPGHGG